MYHYYRDRWTLTLTLASRSTPPLSPRAARARVCVKKEQWRSPHKMSAAERHLPLTLSPSPSPLSLSIRFSYCEAARATSNAPKAKGHHEDGEHIEPLCGEPLLLHRLVAKGRSLGAELSAVGGRGRRW